MAPPSSDRAKAIDRAGLAVQVLLFLAAVGAAAALVVAEQAHRRFGGVEIVTAAELTTIEDRAALVTLIQLATFVPAIIAVIVWFRLLYVPVYEFAGSSLRHKPKWATWGWLVPVLNLVRPPQMMNDAWRVGRRDQPTPPWIAWWWGCLLGSGVLYVVAARMEATTIADSLTGVRLEQLADLLSLVFDVLGLLIVTQLTRDVLAVISDEVDGVATHRDDVALP